MDGFVIAYNGAALTPADGFRPVRREELAHEDGSRSETIHYEKSGEALAVESVTTRYPDSAVVQRRIVVANRSGEPVRVTRLDPFHGNLPRGEYTLDYFRSTNGEEFSPVTEPLAGTKVLQSTAGRSSKGMHPWFALRGADGSILSAAVAWSGNWIFRFEPLPAGRYQISGGMNDWAFEKVLAPGESLESVPVFYASLPAGDLDDVSVEFGRWGKRFWYPANPFPNAVPVAWNHWWPYEDSLINEEVFKANVDVAAQLGVEVCTLDAGWFGEPDPHCNDHRGWSPTVDWVMKRGDWHKINTLRFPSGIRALSDYIHAKGMKFGIWCEIEALGDKSDIYRERPDLPAHRDGAPLGYVCLGNPDAVDWAFGVLEKLIVEYRADWLKLDFNLDPCAGCNRTDHGHAEGDGLHAHYLGYYELLRRLREKYPEVYLENCSSGGLRIDLGIARLTHGAFLSDPDHTRHHLQLFWGASLMLHPSACFHFTWSQTVVFYDNNLEQDPIQADMPRHRFDYIIRANMLNGFGVSYRLPELPDWAVQRLGELIGFFKSDMRRFVGQADMHRLTGQTTREGRGDSWNAYLYVLEGAEEAMLCVFRLAGGEAERTFKLKGLDASATYEIRFTDSGRTLAMSGAALMEEGLAVSGMEEESSDVLMLRKLI